MSYSILFGEQVSLNKKNDRFLHKIFERVTAENPDKIAVLDPERKLTFSELNSKANQLARWIQNNCPRKAELELITLRFEPNVDLLVAIMGILKAGLAYVPIAPDWPESRLEYILRDSKPIFLITNKGDMRPPIETIQFRDLMLSASRYYSDDNIDDGSNQINESFACMYTSGSTGLPKGVRLLHTSAIFRAQWQWKHLPYQSPDDVCAFKAALTFIDAVTEIFSAILSGHTLVIFPREVVRSPAAFTDMCEDYGVRRLYLIPSLMNAMIENMKLKGERKLDRLLLWESTGEAITFEVAKNFYDFFRDRNHRLANVYGGTEMMDNIYEEYLGLDDFKAKMLDGQKPSLGKAVDGSIIYIMNDDLDPVEVGEVGEICMSTPGLAHGYVGQHSHLQAFTQNRHNRTNAIVHEKVPPINFTSFSSLLEYYFFSFIGLATMAGWLMKEFTTREGRILK